ncbi:MAG TPA: hypothetical protein VNZ52_05565 [Candidatus Thermoplasmatota archaeon]|nr:hypothetical protein [Candidatus Thermoplasmatota archaeon]
MPTTGPMRLFGYLGAFGLVLMFLAPNAIPTTVEVVDGHVVFVNMAGYSECLTGIVGLARQKVMWFNDQVLLDSTSLTEGRYLYAVQHGAPDPVDEPLRRTGVYYNFVDPNGGLWNVTEYSYAVDVRQYEGQSGTFGSGPAQLTLTTSGGASIKNFHVWVVKIQAPMMDSPENNPWQNAGETNAHHWYNFVNIVDTCKFVSDGKNFGTKTRDVTHTNQVANGFGHDLEEGLEASEGTHTHEAFKVDLYLGGVPQEIVKGSSSPAVSEDIHVYGRNGADRNGATIVPPLS